MGTITVKDASGANVDISDGGLAAAGKQTAITHTGTTAANIAAANTSRASLSFTNNHATVAVRVKEGAAATSSSGIRVLAGGTYWSDTQDSVSVCPESGTADCFGYEVAV